MPLYKDLAVGDAEKIAQFYHPLLRMGGTVVGLGVSEGGGAYGIWVERDVESAVQMVDPQHPIMRTDQQSRHAVCRIALLVEADRVPPSGCLQSARVRR